MPLRRQQSRVSLYDKIGIGVIRYRQQVGVRGQYDILIIVNVQLLIHDPQPGKQVVLPLLHDG